MASKEKAPARIGAKHSRCKRRQFESTVETPYAMVSQSKRTVNVAVVGAGFTILAHVIALVRAGARVVAVCDTDPGLASKLLGKLSGGRLYTNYEMFLEHESKMRTTERPELLVIAVPNALHEEFAMQALKYGFCLDLEKPITTTLRGARRIRAYAKRNDVPIGVPSCYRFDFMLAVLHWLVANGYAGSVLEAYIKYLQDWGWGGRGWRGQSESSGVGGVMADVGATHAHNMYVWGTNGVAIKKIACQLRYDLAHKGENTDTGMLITGQADGGVTFSLEASQTRHAHMNTRHVEIAGDEATFVYDSRLPTQLEMRQSGKITTLFDDPGVLGPMFPGIAEFLEEMMGRGGGDHFNGDYNESWLRYAEFLLADVRDFRDGNYDYENCTPYANVDDGVDQMFLIEKALASHKDGGKPIDCAL